MVTREDEIIMDINVLRQRIDVLQVELRMVREAKCGVKVGDIVMTKARNRGRNHVSTFEEAKVTGLRFWTDGKPWLTAVLRTKSGEWGKQQRNLFDDWEKA